MNESTKFISPTKTPEYLAAGKPVVSTAITDVSRHYGNLDGVFIANGPAEFVAACENALALPPAGAWLANVDDVLSSMSWTQTVGQMQKLVAQSLAANAVIDRTRPIPRRGDRFDYLVVGAGFAGAVLAERLATQADKRVLLIDRRPHVGGNAYDRTDASGVLMHQYGPHIFHTNSDDVFNYLSQFTAWRPYEHRVLADIAGAKLPIPINRTTLNRLYSLDLHDEAQAAAFLASKAESPAFIRTSEDVVVAAIGRDLYEKFFRGYTRKQWGMEPSELDKSVAARVPTRTNTDDRYFLDKHQAMPLDGYTRMFERMLDHPKITIELDCEFDRAIRTYKYDQLIYTGPIDAYFGHRFGKLPYRSLRFQHETLDQVQFQSVGTVNYPSETVPYTRITEYKHLTGQQHDKTTITYEYPCAEGDPFYPVPRPENQALYKRYETLALAEQHVTFVGRLASYRYYNMDQVVGQALAMFRKISAPERLPALQPANAGRGAPRIPVAIAKTLPASG